MNALLLTAMLGLPLYPLNPIEQDTISLMNLHLTAGIDGPNAVVSAGPQLTAKYEWVVEHPFIVRVAFDCRAGQTHSILYPSGNLRNGTISVEGLYYRGTDRLTGYIGAGVVYAMYSFSASDGAADSLKTELGVANIAVSDVFGYRITAGLRIHKSYSIEVGITEVKPKFVFTRRYSETRYGLIKEQVRLNEFRVSFGYLLTLKGL